MKICSIKGCNEKATRRGWCGKHYQRWKMHGDPNYEGERRSSRGEPYKFLCDAVLSLEKENCILWPFATLNNGYAAINIDKRVQLAHRIVCTMVNGEPPEENSEAAHSCGNGNKGCINPNHLRWATPSENQMDRAEHGTSNRGTKHGMSKRTNEQILEINRLIDEGYKNCQIARMLNEDARFVSMIRYGQIWGWLTGKTR